MVSKSCKNAAREALREMGLHFIIVELGEVEIMETLTIQQHQLLKIKLMEAGLELMDDRRSVLIEKIKNIIIQMVHYSEEPLLVNFSNFLSQKMNLDYTYLSNLFSAVQGTTIEQYIIVNKVEKIKELILYNELNMTEIAWKMHYSSVAHLSNQFKKVTGLSPTHFKRLKDRKRNPLEEL